MTKVKPLPSGKNLITTDNPTRHHFGDPAKGLMSQHFTSLDDALVALASNTLVWVNPSGD